ncbi:MAG: hypothetical protein ACYCSO_04780 [Cuniculiplasma sp.]
MNNTQEENSGIHMGLVNSSAEYFDSNLNLSNYSFPFYVSGQNYYNRSGIYFTSRSSNISLNLSWNENESYSMTESSFNISYEGRFILGNFGLKDGSGLLIGSKGSKTKILTMGQNTFYNISFYFEGSTVLIMVNRNSQMLYYGAFKPGIANICSEEINATITGNYYNIIFNCPRVGVGISEYNHFINSPEYSPLSRKFTNISAGVEKGFVCDRALGIYLGIKNKDSIVEYNPQSNESRVIFHWSTWNVVQSAMGKNLSYWLIKKVGEEEYSVVGIYNENLSVINLGLSYDLGTHRGLFIYKSSAAIYSNEKAFFANNGTIIKNYSNLASENYNILGVYVKNEIPMFLFHYGKNISVLDDLTGKLTYYMEPETVVNQTLQDGTTLLGISFMSNESNIYYPELGVSTILPLLNIGNGNLAFRDSRESLALMNGTTGSTHYVRFAGNLTSIFVHSYMACSNSTMLLYSSSNFAIPHVNITTEDRYLFSPLGYFNFSIKSSLSFLTTLSIGNKSFKGNNTESFYLNMTDFMTGSYNYVLRIVTEDLYYFTHSGVVQIDNSFPHIHFNENISSGIYSGEKISAIYCDGSGIKNVTVQGMNYDVESGRSTLILHAPDNHRGNNISLSISFIDCYNVKREINLEFRYFLENESEFVSSIFNGEVFNSTTIPVSFSGSFQNLSFIFLHVENLKENRSFNFTFYNYSGKICLPEGRYIMKEYGVYRAGNSVLLDMENFTILTEKLSVNINAQEHNFYSFTGNSMNNTFNYSLQSNINGTWSVRMLFYSSLIYHKEFQNRLMHLDARKLKGLLKLNGTYTIYFNFTSINGYFYSSSSKMNVNNSIPSYEGRSIFYINSSSLNISSYLSHSLRYEIEKNGTYENFSGLITLKQQGTFLFNILMWSNSMNHNSNNITVVYSKSKPSISINNWHNQWNKSSRMTFTLLYGKTISITEMKISGGGKITGEGHGNYTLLFNEDGIYNLTIGEIDVCGNRNGTELQVNVTAFPYVYSMSVSYTIVFQHLTGHVEVKGYDLSDVNTSWYYEGRTISHGKSINEEIPMGIDHVTAIVKFRNESIIRNITVIGLSPYVLLPPALLILFIIIVKNFPVNNDSTEMINTILGNDDFLLKDIIRELRKKHFPKRKIRMALDLLARKNMVRILSDPDGKPRLEIIVNNKKK